MTLQDSKLEKYVDTIEKSLQIKISKENKQHKIEQYKRYLIEELDKQTKQQKILEENIDRINSKTKNSALKAKCRKLQDDVLEREKELAQLKETLEKMSIQCAAEKEHVKQICAEKNAQTKSINEGQIMLLAEQLLEHKTKHSQIEQELEHQIRVELTSRSFRLSELRSSLQKKIIEKNALLMKIQMEQKELRQMCLLKTPQRPNVPEPQKVYQKGGNVMEFRNQHLLEQNSKASDVKTTIKPHQKTDVVGASGTSLCQEPLKCAPNTGDDRVPSRSGYMSEYSTTESEYNYLEFERGYMELMANNHKQMGAANQNLNQLKGTAPNKNSRQVGTTLEKLSDAEMSYYAAEYAQFNDTFTQSHVDLDQINRELQNLVPNPYSSVNKTDKSAKTSSSRTESITVQQPKSEASFLIEDTDIFDDILMDRNSSVESCEASEVKRKLPTLYVGAKRRLKNNYAQQRRS